MIPPTHGSNLVSLDRIDVVKDETTILDDVTWQWRRGESWHVHGPNGAGKSTFLQLLHGDMWPHHSSRGRRLYNLDGVPTESPVGVARRIGLVSAEQQDFYHRAGVDLTGEQVILSGITGAIWNQGVPPESHREQAMDTSRRLGIGPLSGKRFLEMSSGERRKTLIARALVANPGMLLLDEALDYLDSRSRGELLELLGTLITDGLLLVYTTHRETDVVPGTTHRLELEGGRVAQSSRIEDSSPAVPSGSTPTFRDEVIPGAGDEPLVVIHKADVYIADKKILHSIDWTIRSNENWALIGENGSGKSTLLRLIVGDHYPAWGGAIDRFDLKSTGSIWEAKRRIGFVSADLQTTWPPTVSARNVVLSGFFGTRDVYTEPTREQLEKADKTIGEFALEDLAAREFGTLSYGERRRTLMARAIASDPMLLVLDEPCNGLDATTRDLVLARIHAYSMNAGRILFATHHADEIPDSVGKVATIEEGRLSLG